MFVSRALLLDVRTSTCFPYDNDKAVGLFILLYNFHTPTYIILISLCQDFPCTSPFACIR